MYKFIFFILLASPTLAKPSCSDPLQCPDLRVPCQNRHNNKHYYYWQQGDGVCDCCDGSDEPPGQCEDICERLAQEEVAAKRRHQIVQNMGRAKRLSLQKQQNVFVSSKYKDILERLARDKDVKKAIADYSAIQNHQDCSIYTPFWQWRPEKTVTVTVTQPAEKRDNIWSLLPECIVKQIGKYEYSFCPFQNITQREISKKRNSVILGYFDKHDRKTMKFANGQGCWKGPARSVTVDLQCAAVEEIADVDEPEQCTYRMLVKTCAVC